MIERYRNSERISVSSLEWMMKLVENRREAVDQILGHQVAETLLYTLGRVQTTPDAEIVDENVMHQRWTGD